ncbi:MAG: hypothetical protein CSA22_10055 [Deltaproteobacteria bacterium]|nr:MAG: hypothetical protein CSA22_10055 [Deltaproteobacteria bacterium]
MPFPDEAPGTVIDISQHLPKNDHHLHELILAARGIPFHVEPQKGAPQLMVPESVSTEAICEIRTYYRENILSPKPPLPPVRSSAAPVIWVAFLWATLHAAMAYWNNRETIIPLVNADSTAILGGSIHRCITALFFHGDSAHLSGNIAFLLILGIPVIQLFGSGAGLLLILFTGIAGNLTAALYHGHLHHAIGGSTAVFGCAGLLCGYQVVHRGRHRLPLNMTGWAPVGAGAALIAILGMGENADIPAHVFGTLWGGGAGFCAAHIPGPLLDRKPVQHLLTGIAVILVLTAAVCAISITQAPV